MALVFKDIALDLTSVPEKDKKVVKQKIADLVYDEVLRYISKGKSPVQGERDFKTLNSKYAKREKQGNKTPNLQLEGDLIREDFDTMAMLDADIVRVGHFKANTADTQGEKADGHNQHSAKAQAWAISKETPFPKRRYIPNEAQAFKSDIMDKVQNVIDKFSVSSFDITADVANTILQDSGRVTTVRETTEVTQVGINDYLSDEYLAELIGERLNQ